KNCLLQYIKNIKNTMYYADSNTYLDVHIRTKKQCIQHEISRKTGFCLSNIQEWCEYCSEIAYFIQVVAEFDKIAYFIQGFDEYKKEKILENEKYCKLCGKKLIYQQVSFLEVKFKMCSDCYVISSGWIKSTLNKKLIPILYLPWWDVSRTCIACCYSLKFTSDCQKWCLRCNIVYTGCRYCLTTNIIFGITDFSQCKKCRRTLSIDDLKFDITSICSGNEFLGYNNYHLIADYENYVTNLNKNSNPLSVYGFVRDLTPAFKWYPYSEFNNFKKIAEGGFGIVYRATLDGKTVAVKRFSKSRNIDKYFLNEVIII